MPTVDELMDTDFDAEMETVEGVSDEPEAKAAKVPAGSSGVEQVHSPDTPPETKVAEKADKPDKPTRKRSRKKKDPEPKDARELRSSIEPYKQAADLIEKEAEILRAQAKTEDYNGQKSIEWVHADQLLQTSNFLRERARDIVGSFYGV